MIANLQNLTHTTESLFVAAILPRMARMGNQLDRCDFHP
jgi:hypothetical protein